MKRKDRLTRFWPVPIRRCCGEPRGWGGGAAPVHGASLRLLLSRWIWKLPLFFLLLGPCAWPAAFARAAAPSVEDRLAAESAKLEKAKAEVQGRKDAWDKSRLETTLYDQRAKRAYQRWVKAKKGGRAPAQASKERADLEFQLSVEKRKYAYNEWQAALLRQQSIEDGMKALDQEKDGAEILEKIHSLEKRLSPPGAGSTPAAK